MISNNACKRIRISINPELKMPFFPHELKMIFFCLCLFLNNFKALKSVKIEVCFHCNERSELASF